jgi:hypothetical protein
MGCLPKTVFYAWLVTILKEINNDETQENVKKKISSLRTNYRKALKKENYWKYSGVGSSLVMMYTNPTKRSGLKEIEFSQQTVKFKGFKQKPKNNEIL